VHRGRRPWRVACGRGASLAGVLGCTLECIMSWGNRRIAVFAWVLAAVTVACSEDTLTHAEDAGVDASAEDAAADACGASPLADLASTQKVSFRTTNVGSKDAWVVTSGRLCSVFGIKRLSPSPASLFLTGTTLDPDDDCCISAFGCDFDGRCAEAYARVSPGATLDLTWDARALVADDCVLQCPGMTVASRRTARQPVQAGSYEVTIGYSAKAPNCGTVDTDAGLATSCCPGMATPHDLEPMCTAEAEAHAQFELQEGIDLVVPVSIP
jgi:hypothetical protein